jgi:dsDNA-specific endonuclease/ATPase MutS2
VYIVELGDSSSIVATHGEMSDVERITLSELIARAERGERLAASGASLASEIPNAQAEKIKRQAAVITRLEREREESGCAHVAEMNAQAEAISRLRTMLSDILAAAKGKPTPYGVLAFIIASELGIDRASTRNIIRQIGDGADVIAELRERLHTLAGTLNRAGAEYAQVCDRLTIERDAARAKCVEWAQTCGQRIATESLGALATAIHFAELEEQCE